MAQHEHLSGTLPVAVSKMTHLYLQYNGLLRGSIPPPVGLLVALRGFHVEYNELRGPMLSTLKSRDSLWLQQRFLPLPSNFAQSSMPQDA